LNLGLPFRILLTSDKHLFISIRNLFGFCPHNIKLYQLAFRHKSAAKEKINGIKMSNERLEYLGDAVLSSIVADYLFKKFPYKEEGFLTEMRAKIVSRTQLNSLSLKLGINRLVETEIVKNVRSKSVNGNAFEAFIGALYLDRGYRYTRKIILKRVIDIHLDIEKLETENRNFKSQLIEWSQKEKVPVTFKVVEEVGDGYGKQYIVEARINKKSYSTGRDFSIKGAEQFAAEKALQKIQTQEE
jgi:ribonuclease-3